MRRIDVHERKEIQKTKISPISVKLTDNTVSFDDNPALIQFSPILCGCACNRGTQHTKCVSLTDELMLILQEGIIRHRDIHSDLVAQTSNQSGFHTWV